MPVGRQQLVMVVLELGGRESAVKPRSAEPEG